MKLLNLVFFRLSDLSFKTATGENLLLKRRMLTILEAYTEESPYHRFLPHPTLRRSQDEGISAVSPRYLSVATILIICWVESYEKLHFTGEMSCRYSLDLSLIRLHCIVAKAVNLPKTFFARTPYCYATVSTSAGQTRHTKTIKHVDPMWNETFVL
jgi:hypothetical protein